MRAVPTLVGTHLKRYGELLIVPSIAKLRYWHRQINEEFFQGVLSTPKFKLDKDYDGYGCWFNNELTINSRICNKRHLLITTLAHEMVHQYQDETGHTPDHGHAFQVKASNIAKHLGYPVA